MNISRRIGALLVTDAPSTSRLDLNVAPTFTPRQRRTLVALWDGPLMREAVDRIAGCSNGPQLISYLKAKGVDIQCELVHSLDRDGKPSKPGRYSLTDRGRAKLVSYGWGCS